MSDFTAAILDISLWTNREKETGFLRSPVNLLNIWLSISRENFG